MRFLKSFGLVKTLMWVFGLLTVPVMICIYNDMSFPGMFQMVVLYFMTAVLLLISIPVIGLRNARHFTKIELIGMSKRFFTYLTIIGTLNYALHLILGTEDLNLFRLLGNGAVVAAMAAYFEIIFFRRTDF